MFDSLPLAANLGIFFAAAAAVWAAGGRLSRLAEVIADRTGLSHEFVGMLLLAVATSLPEVATTATAGWIGNARLAINNLVGTVPLLRAVLALADLFLVRTALTFFTPRPVLLLQGTLVILLLGLTMAGGAMGMGGGMGGGAVSVWSMGLWPPAIAVVFVFGLRASRRYEDRPAWRPAGRDADAEGVGKGQEGAGRGEEKEEGEGGRERSLSTRGAALRFAGASAAVLAAGWALSGAADALAAQTGLGGSFVGVTLLSAATSLPEISTTVTAVRRGSYGLALSNIFGSNAFGLTLLVVADVFYRPGPVLAETDRSALFAAALGVVMTGVTLWGLIERRNRTVLRMGIDSALTLALYAAGLAGLYALRGA